MSETESEDGAKFAVVMRHIITEPERWARLVEASRGIIGEELPDEINDLTIIALAHVVMARSAKTLPDGDPLRVSAEQLLKALANAAE
jgi:hypothetical protein